MQNCNSLSEIAVDTPACHEISTSCSDPRAITCVTSAVSLAPNISRLAAVAGAVLDKAIERGDERKKLSRDYCNKPFRRTPVKSCEDVFLSTKLNAPRSKTL